MSNEWAHDAMRKEVPTVKSITPGGHALLLMDRQAVLVGAGTARPRCEEPNPLVQGRSGFASACSAASGAVVIMRPRMALKKNPFTTHGAGSYGALLGPHRAWDPV
jgi:hypothetical protein